jgi:hypothetical protein
MLNRLKKQLGKWLIRQGEQLLRQQRDENVLERIKNLREYWFLADAPLFIDAPQVMGLYDAIFRPEFEVASRTRSRSDTKAEELSAEINSSTEVAVPTIFKVSAAGKIGNKLETTTSGVDSLTETAVLSPERRLEKLVNLYAYSYPHRLYRIDSQCISLTDLAGKSFNWEEVTANLNQPGIRPLIFFDLDKGARFIPMFAELNTGGRVELYKEFIASVSKDSAVPGYPKRGSANYDEDKKTYWKALWTAFDSEIAMETIEKATHNGGRIDWIDFRIVGFREGVPVPIHLHLSPRGQFPMGTFAYQLVRRGENHGVRLLGTLKKGEDVNVLAIYER